MQVLTTTPPLPTGTPWTRARVHRAHPRARRVPTAARGRSVSGACLHASAHYGAARANGCARPICFGCLPSADMQVLTTAPAPPLPTGAHRRARLGGGADRARFRRVRARSRARQIDCRRDLERARWIAIVISSAPDRMASDRAIGWRLIAIVIASDCGRYEIELCCARDCA
jgi:hypothetical protein